MRRSPPPSAAPPFGFVETFGPGAPGEHARVEQAVAGMLAAGASLLHLPVSRSDYRAPGGQDWYDWLLPLLARAFELLPCVEAVPAAGADEFLDHLLTRHGTHFTHVGLRASAPDRDPRLFSDIAGMAARRGVRPVLVAPEAADARWLAGLGEAGALDGVAAILCHGPDETRLLRDPGRDGFDAGLAERRATLARHDCAAELWLATGAPADDEALQVTRFREALAAPVERFYWQGWQDGPRRTGVTDAAGRPKLLRRLLETGEIASLPTPQLRRPAAPVVILGGAGFIGSNLADALLQDGREVVVFDSLSRPGVERNLAWLRARGGARLHPVLADIRDPIAMAEAVAGAAAVFHLAAQVAVTSSLLDPRHDFSVNAGGTLNVLETVRLHAPTAPVVFASTNKVYGQLADVPVSDSSGLYLPQDNARLAFGVDEQRPLDFCTPYGCSKGVADQYVLDYAHSFGLRSAVLRMSCIYGPRQFGTEDQGWIAHFLIRALRGEPITIFGDGKQVRDVLHVRDAVRAYRAVLDRIDQVSGRAFNLGGGPANAVSLHMVLSEIGLVLGREVGVSYEPWRAGDQPYFVADTRRLSEAVGWRAEVGWQEGLRDLAGWLRADLEVAAPGHRAAGDLPEKRRLLA